MCAKTRSGSDHELHSKMYQFVRLLQLKLWCVGEFMQCVWIIGVSRAYTKHVVLVIHVFRKVSSSASQKNKADFSILNIKRDTYK